MVDTSAPDATRRSERARRAIHEAALALVAEAGYRKTTIEGIAARAGVGKQTIYRWWPSKAEVLLEAFLDLVEQHARQAGEVPYEIPDTGDVAADLKAVLRATVDQLLDPRFAAPSRALAAEGLVDEQLGRRVVATLLEPQLQLYVRRLRAAQQAGQVRADVDPRIALELFVSPARPALAAAHRTRLPRVHRHPRRLRPARAGAALTGPPAVAHHRPHRHPDAGRGHRKLRMVRPWSVLSTPARRGDR